METKVVVVAYTEYDAPDKAMQAHIQKQIDDALKTAGEEWKVKSIESRIATNGGYATSSLSMSITAEQFTVFLFTIVLEKWSEKRECDALAFI